MKDRWTFGKMWNHSTAWLEYSPRPLAGVAKVDKKWYVWPPEFFTDDEEDIVRQSPCGPFPTRKAAMAACELLYRTMENND